jgi:8-oxo-dGTP pyrophosphatase MutT (NUDIX family)
LSAFTWPPDPSALGATDRPASAAEEIPAAVLVPLFLGGPEAQPHVVLTRRRADLKRHAGEISFPGGRRDADDADLSETALREAEEEIGLPRTEATLLGELPATSTFATNYVIHPFAALIPEGLAWRLSPREVDAVLELGLAELRGARTRTQLERRGITFETDAFVLDGNVIWGATARILDDLLGLLDAASAQAAGGALDLRALSGKPTDA